MKQASQPLPKSSALMMATGTPAEKLGILNIRRGLVPNTETSHTACKSKGEVASVSMPKSLSYIEELHLKMPIKVAERSKARTVFAWMAGSNPT
jgi:hypothetical protein